MTYLVRPIVVTVSFALLASLALPAASEPLPAPMAEGVLRLQSTHSVANTVQRLKAAVEAKGIRFFDAIDQHALAKGAKLKTSQSTLVVFGISRSGCSSFNQIVMLALTGQCACSLSRRRMAQCGSPGATFHGWRIAME